MNGAGEFFFNIIKNFCMILCFLGGLSLLAMSASEVGTFWHVLGGVLLLSIGGAIFKIA